MLYCTAIWKFHMKASARSEKKGVSNTVLEQNPHSRLAGRIKVQKAWSHSEVGTKTDREEVYSSHANCSIQQKCIHLNRTQASAPTWRVKIISQWREERQELKLRNLNLILHTSRNIWLYNNKITLQFSECKAIFKWFIVKRKTAMQIS